jgi:hypothetical protein
MSDAPIPSEWKQFVTGTNKKYYYNVKSRTTIWYHPLIYIKLHGQPTSEMTTAPNEANKTVIVADTSVKMPSTRPTWVQDDSVNNCFSCNSKFNLINRKVS